MGPVVEKNSTLTRFSGFRLIIQIDNYVFFIKPLYDSIFNARV